MTGQVCAHTTSCEESLLSCEFLARLQELCLYHAHFWECWAITTDCATILIQYYQLSLIAEIQVLSFVQKTVSYSNKVEQHKLYW